MENKDYAIVPAENPKWIALQTKEALTPMQINKQLMVLATAFPSVVRNYDEYEHQTMRELWYEIFKNVPEELLQESIKRFIINERKGFFPSPGQIIGVMIEIVKKRENDKLMKLLMDRDRRNEEGTG